MTNELLSAAVVTGLVLYATGASTGMLRGFLAGCVMIAIGFLLLPLLKVSLHLMFAGFSAMILLERFGFTLPACGGRTLGDADFAGKALVIYFYPKDATPGCTV